MTDSNVVDLQHGNYFRVYDGYLMGERINSVSFEAEVTFWRLNTLADHFGCLKRETSKTMQRKLFPLRDDVLPNSVDQWLGELEDAKLIQSYTTSCETECLVIRGYVILQKPKNGKRVQRVPELPSEDLWPEGEELAKSAKPSSTKRTRPAQSGNPTQETAGPGEW